MTNNDTTCITRPHTLQDVVQLIAHHPDLNDIQKRDLTSAVRKVARLISPLDLQHPASPALLAARLAGVTPAMAGVSTQTFANLKSRLRRALRLAEVMDAPGPRNAPLEKPWEEALGLVDDAWLLCRLGRFARFAAEQGWRPEEIGTQHFLRYRAWLEEKALVVFPARSYRRASSAWNQACEAIPAWPGRPVDVAMKRTPYMVQWQALPETLRREIDDYLDARKASDGSAASLFEEQRLRPLRQRTIDLRRVQILQYVSALHQTGTPLTDLSSVAAVTTAEAIKRGLTFFQTRAGGTVPAQIHFIAIALHGLVAFTLDDPQRLSLLQGIIRKTRSPRRGLTEKNQRRLVQFDNPRLLAALLHLPAQLAREADEAGGLEGARLSEMALAIEVLLNCPMRVGNLVTIHLERNLVRSDAGGRHLRLVFEEHEVKNSRRLDFPLPAEAQRLLTRHIDKHRPLLPGAQSPWLFPSTDGRACCYKVMGHRISTLLRRRIGIEITPHLFRHLSAKLFLAQHPVGHETVRRLLGHASVDTTTQYYAGFDTSRAAAIYDAHILSLRQTLPAPRKPRRTR